jgi:KTSC domain
MSNDDLVSQFLGITGKSRADAVFPIPIPLKESSCVAYASYDIFTGQLAITFHDGSEANYTTDIVTIIEWMRAKSVGSFYNLRIKGQ